MRASPRRRAGRAFRRRPRITGSGAIERPTGTSSTRATDERERRDLVHEPRRHRDAGGVQPPADAAWLGAARDQRVHVRLSAPADPDSTTSRKRTAGGATRQRPLGQRPARCLVGGRIVLGAGAVGEVDPDDDLDPMGRRRSGARLGAMLAAARDLGHREARRRERVRRGAARAPGQGRPIGGRPARVSCGRRTCVAMISDVRSARSLERRSRRRLAQQTLEIQLGVDHRDLSLRVAWPLLARAVAVELEAVLIGIPGGRAPRSRGRRHPRGWNVGGDQAPQRVGERGPGRGERMCGAW
mgnify:CR=1 FL=1